MKDSYDLKTLDWLECYQVETAINHKFSQENELSESDECIDTPIQIIEDQLELF